MTLFRSSLALALLACAAGCHGSAGQGGEPADFGVAPANDYVVDQPAAGQALITGTVQSFVWHGGAASDVVDVWFQPASGAAVALAENVINTGQTTATVHLLAAEQRAGGTISVRATSAGPPAAMNAHGRIASGAASDDVAGTVKVGSLASFAWNGSSEDYFWLDVTTGVRQEVGTVGDLASWTMKTLAVDYDAGRLYVIGFDATMTQKLYVLDSKNGTLIQTTPIQSATSAFLGIQIVTGPRLVAYFWDGTHEQMVSIDMTSGAVTTLGAVGDLAFWSGETAYDPATDTAYVLGNPMSATPTGGPLTLYSLDATTGSLLGEQPITEGGSSVQDVMGVVANAAGALLGFRWNGSAEEMLALDPKTGDATALGTVGDLAFWNGIATIDLTANIVYVLGNASAMPMTMMPRLYALDGASGALLYATDLSLPMLPTQAVLVY